MMSKIKLLFIVLVLSLTGNGFAQSDTLEVSLNQAMAYATEFGYQSINAQHDIEIAKKKVRETLAIGLPQVTGSGSLSNNLKLQKNQIQFGDSVINTVFGTKYNSSIGGRVDQLLFDGSYLVGLKASKVYVRLSEGAKEKTDIEIKRAVAEAYFLTLVAKQNIKDFKRNLAINEKFLRETEAYFENGFKEDIDVDQMKLMVNESKRLHSNAENQLTIALSVLKFAMGYNIDKPLKLSDEIINLLASIPVKLENGNEIQSHIDYRNHQTQLDIKDLDIKNQQALAMPKLSAFLTYDFTYYGQELSDLSKTQGSILGLSLSIPIFSSGKRSAQLKQKKLEFTKLNVEKDLIEQTIKKDLFISKANLSNAKKQFENAKLSKEISMRIFDKSLIKFKNGLLNSINLSQNENDMTESILNYNNASANYFNLYIAYKKASSQL